MISGIIAEYNPFHNGHKYHIEKTKKITNSSFCIVVMSGNFVQRGEPAIINKFARTKAALLNGADMVIELPSFFATAGADIFSLGAIDLLNKTKIVTNVCFGSENGSIDTLLKISTILAKEPEEFKAAFANYSKQGLSYPDARLKALSYITNTDLSFLKSPNNILALEYLKALKLTDSDITPYTIQRKSAEFHSQNISGTIASATAIRLSAFSEQTKIKNCIPQNTHNIFFNELNKKIVLMDDYSDILHYILRTKSAKELSEISDITEGIENRIIKNSDKKYISEIILSVKTKRYTYTKIQRAILHIILGITKEQMNLITKNNLNQYIRILGFKKSSSDLLTLLTKKASVPVITNIKKAKHQLNEFAFSVLQQEFKATDLYYMPSTLETNKDYTEPIVII